VPTVVASLKVEISLTLMEIPDRLYVGNAAVARELLMTRVPGHEGRGLCPLLHLS